MCRMTVIHLISRVHPFFLWRVKYLSLSINYCLPRPWRDAISLHIKKPCAAWPGITRDPILYNNVDEKSKSTVESTAQPQRPCNNLRDYCSLVTLSIDCKKCRKYPAVRLLYFTK